MKSLTEISKLIALVLRHKPEALDMRLDAHGWADTATLIERINATQPFDMAMLEEIVRTDNKQRYSFNADKTAIRANQGHSIPVDLELAPKQPPKQLWHGTGEKSVAGILERGIIPKGEKAIVPKGRQYVHLSADPELAGEAGSRNGSPFIFAIDAEAMARQGIKFYQSEDGVWLTDWVPKRFFKGVIPWKDPEWFESLREKAEKMRASASIARNCVDKWYLVERINTYREDKSNGISLYRKHIFCLGEYGDYYVFSDGEYFYVTCIDQDWDPSYDRIRWERFDSFEALHMRYRHYKREAPIEQLPGDLLIIIRDYIPTFNTCEFVYARKPDSNVTVRLNALYEYNAESRSLGVKLCLTKLVGNAEAVSWALVQGTQDEVFDWLEAPAHQQEVVTLADALLKDIPPQLGDEV